jgi:hypothetical protein
MKRSPEREQRILQAVRAGNTLKAAAAYGGIDEATLWRWTKSSATFASLLSRAEQEAEVALVANIRLAGQADWRAHAWLLERRNPTAWGRRDRLDVKIDAEQRIRLMARELGFDEEEALIEAQRILGADAAAR